MMDIHKIEEKNIYFSDRKMDYISLEKTSFFDEDGGPFVFFKLETQDSTLFLRENIVVKIEEYFKKVIKSYPPLVKRSYRWHTGSMTVISPAFAPRLFHKVWDELLPIFQNIESYATEDELITASKIKKEDGGK